ncbi:MAG TPA: EamA family transporter [Mycobacteriales bacterium]|nr:EamA family transporter [Mycobacteriales bacterium]
MPPPTWQLWTALGLVYVVWGSTYLAIVYVVETLPPLLSAGARFAVAAAMLALWLVLRQGWQGVVASRREWGAGAVIGLLLLLGGNGGVTLAEDADLPSGLTALLVASVPLWIVVLRSCTGDRPAGRTLIGVAVGFAGVALLLLPGARPDSVPLLAAATVVVGSICWSIGTFLSPRLGLPRNPLLGAVAQMAGGAIGLLVAGLLRGEQFEPQDVSLVSALGLIYLVVFGSLVAFTAYSWLLRVAPVSQVATYAYVNPVVAVALGALFVGEEVGLLTLLGGAVIVAAVAIVVGEESRRKSQLVHCPADAGAQAPVERQGRNRSSET